jgi:hypothetical protein
VTRMRCARAKGVTFTPDGTRSRPHTSTHAHLSATKCGSDSASNLALCSCPAAPLQTSTWCWRDQPPRRTLRVLAGIVARSRNAVVRTPFKPLFVGTRRNMGKIVEGLAGHQLVQSCLADGVQVDQESGIKGSRLGLNVEYSRELTEGEFYVVKCGSSVAHLLSLVEQLEHIPAYMAHYERTAHARRVGVVRVKHMAYHAENFLVRARGLEDRVLNLVQAILHLGLDTRDVRRQSLTRNSHVKSSAGLPQLLKKLAKLTQPMSEERNNVVHERGHLDEDLRRMEFWWLVTRLAGVDKGRYQSQYISGVRNYVARKNPEIESFTEEASAFLVELFDRLLLDYAAMKRRLLP